MRALAVILVLLFHAFPSLVPGGFIGVDVFFVISGFVISRTYLDRLASGSTSLASFYAARFRRLAPGLVTCLLGTAIAATAILLPNDLLRFAKSLLAQPAYLQNFVFWNEGDYFDRAITKPLLHTWSLAVEEQFYIVFGLLILTCKGHPKHILSIVAAFSILSLAVGYVLAPISPKTVFFMLPTRIWQLALGLFAYVVASRLSTYKSLVLGYLPVAAVIVILFSGLGFEEQARFPGAQSVLACGATAIALALFHLKPSPAGFFTWRPMSYVGKISYVLYLWHWPIISLATMKLGHALTALEASAALCVSLILSILTYHFIEMPIRSRRIIPTGRTLVAGCAGASLLIAASASALIASDGALFLYPKALRPLFKAAQERTPYRCPKWYRILHPTAEICPDNTVTGAPGLVIVGDSHADQIDELIAGIGAKYGVPVFMTARNCSLGTYGLTHFCRPEILDQILDQAERRGVTDLLAVSMWHDRLLATPAFEREITRIRAAGMRVWLFQSVPRDPGFDPVGRAERVLSGAPLSLDGIPVADYRRKSAKQRRVFSALHAAFGNGVRLLSPEDQMCPGGVCRFQTRGLPNYLDDSHVTRAGAERLRPVFEAMFQALRN